MAYLGLYALQHRGQESAGIAVSDGLRVRAVRQMGYVADIFTQPLWPHCQATSPSATRATRLR